MVAQDPEHQLIEKLRKLGDTLATAESCTGGLLGHRITNVSGASEVYLGGVVAYSNAVKSAALGVDKGMLMEHGAVSETVARAMAEGVRKMLGADWGIGITGVAGPNGGTAEKPVGLVYVALAGADATQVVRNLFSGSRFDIKGQSTDCALQMLLEVLG